MNCSIVANESLFTRTAPLNRFNYASSSLNDALFSPPHPAPTPLFQSFPWLATPLLAGTPGLVRSADPPPRFQRWYLLLGEGQMTPHVCIFCVHSRDGARWMKRQSCDRTEASRRVKQHLLRLKVSAVRGRLFRPGLCWLERISGLLIKL